jgi:hypothetical protein
MKNEEIAKKQAMQAAKNDIKNGLECDAAKHGALRGSAYETWYTGYFKEIIQKQSNRFKAAKEEHI